MIAWLQVSGTHEHIHVLRIGQRNRSTEPKRNGFTPRVFESSLDGFPTDLKSMCHLLQLHWNRRRARRPRQKITKEGTHRRLLRRCQRRRLLDTFGVQRPRRWWWARRVEDGIFEQHPMLKFRVALDAQGDPRPPQGFGRPSRNGWLAPQLHINTVAVRDEEFPKVRHGYNCQSLPGNLWIHRVDSDSDIAFTTDDYGLTVRNWPVFSQGKRAIGEALKNLNSRPCHLLLNRVQPGAIRPAPSAMGVGRGQVYNPVQTDGTDVL